MGEKPIKSGEKRSRVMPKKEWKPSRIGWFRSNISGILAYRQKELRIK